MAGKQSRLWIVNVISLFLFSLLSITGLINWLLLPRGHGSSAGFLVSLRHSLVTMHEWTALLFMIVIGVPISLHWPYVKKSLYVQLIIKQACNQNSPISYVSFLNFTLPYPVNWIVSPFAMIRLGVTWLDHCLPPTLRKASPDLRASQGAVR
jgi:hypothetical protein